MSPFNPWLTHISDFTLTFFFYFYGQQLFPRTISCNYSFQSVAHSFVNLSFMTANFPSFVSLIWLTLLCLTKQVLIFTRRTTYSDRFKVCFASIHPSSFCSLLRPQLYLYLPIESMYIIPFYTTTRPIIFT